MSVFGLYFESKRPSRLIWHMAAGFRVMCTAGFLLSANAAIANPAATLPEKAGAARSVALFDQACYETTPDLALIEKKAAEQKWTALTGTALKAFSPDASAEMLKAWTFKDKGRTFHVSMARSALDAAMKEAMPAFADGKSYSCSLNLSGKTPPEEISAAMQALIGRAADETFDQPPFAVEFWSGVTPDLAALVYHYRPKSGKPGGLLSVVVLKND